MQRIFEIFTRTISLINITCNRIILEQLPTCIEIYLSLSNVYLHEKSFLCWFIGHRVEKAHPMEWSRAVVEKRPARVKEGRDCGRFREKEKGLLWMLLDSPLSFRPSARPFCSTFPKTPSLYSLSGVNVCWRGNLASSLLDGGALQSKSWYAVRKLHRADVAFHQ